MQLKILYYGNPDKHKVIDGLSLNGELLTTSDRESALEVVGRENPQFVLIDFDQPQRKLLDFVDQLLSVSPQLIVFGLTLTSPLGVVVKAVKMGVQEVINTREDPHKLQKELSNLIQNWEDIDKGEDLHQKERQKYDFTNLIGQSAELQHVLEIVTKIIQRKWVTVLIQGETGTGKELIARAIHYNSFNQFQPFVEINCNALPETLLESELFGYEKGAFTDARTQKKGLFELAQHGTLFLDEIGDISQTIQVKLLKALEEKKIRRLGGTKDIQIETRIIAATNRDLKAAMQEGAFRNDLYYRLNVISIPLPPLRDWGDDVLLLAHHFLSQYAAEYESPTRAFTAEVETMLQDYDWPGNIRELSHTIERLALLGESETVSRTELAEALESETALILAKKRRSNTLQIDIPQDGFTLEEGEKLLISAVLEQMEWNKRKTSTILKISRPRLDRKIEKYGLISPKGRR